MISHHVNLQQEQEAGDQQGGLRLLQGNQDQVHQVLTKIDLLLLKLIIINIRLTKIFF